LHSFQDCEIWLQETRDIVLSMAKHISIVISNHLSVTRSRTWQTDGRTDGQTLLVNASIN